MSRKNKTAELEVRRQKVAANLLAGLNYREMAGVLGVSIATIKKDVDIVMGRWQRDQADKVEEYVLLQIRRIDRAINAIWEGVSNGNVQEIDRLQRLIEQQMKLMGIQAPIKILTEHTGRDGGPIETRSVVIYIPDNGRD